MGDDFVVAVKSRLAMVLLIAGMAASVFAARVTESQARLAAENWLTESPALGCGLGTSVASVRTCTPTNGVVFHVVRLTGGGFVVVSGDTEIEPVIAFSDSGEWVEDVRNPLWALLARDLADRTRRLPADGAVPLSVVPAGAAPSSVAGRWARLLGRGARPLGLTSVSDVRVPPLVKSIWGQENNSYYANFGSDCYNYYTPNHYVCGCTATALAQIMRYHRYPASVEPVARKCAVDGGARQSYSMMGGTYDYDDMPLVPEADSLIPWYVSGATEAQRRAIGKLTYDCGVAMCMNWCYADGEGFGGASAVGGFAHEPLVNVFKFANARSYMAVSIPVNVLRQVIFPNLDAGYPVLVGVAGHQVIADGYGYSGGVPYTHLNMGWSGADDAWYNLPTISSVDGNGYLSSVVSHLVYNIFPDKTGDILSGRVTDSSGVAVAGAVVEVCGGSGTVLQTTTTDTHGVYAFILPGGATYSVSATVGTAVASRKGISLGKSVNPSSVNLETGKWYAGTMAYGNSWGNDLSIMELTSVAAPIFVPGSCSFYPSTNVAIVCSAENATIHYTLDGSDPDGTSMVYTGPIPVDDNVTIRARAFVSGGNPSAVASASYVYDIARGAPQGDYFTTAIAVSGATGSHVIEDMEAFSLEKDEPVHTLLDGVYSHQYQTAWLLWTAPGTGTMTFTAKCTGSYRYPTAVAVYAGTNILDLVRLAMSKDYRTSGDYSTSVSLPVEKGRVYRIVGVALYDLSGDEARFRFEWSGELVGDESGDLPPDKPDPVVPEPPRTEQKALVGAVVGTHGIWNLADLGVDLVCSEGERITAVKVEGCPGGLRVGSDAGKTSWWLEGVPKETFSGERQTAYARVTRTRGTTRTETVQPLSFEIVAALAHAFELGDNVTGPRAVAFPEDVVSVSGLPAGLAFTTRTVVKVNRDKSVTTNALAHTVYGVPSKVGLSAVKVTTSSGGVKTSRTEYWQVGYSENHGVLEGVGWDAATVVDDRVATVMQGASRRWTITPPLGAKVSASGLPTGLKLVQDKATGVYSVEGTPTKAGNFVATFKTTLNGVTVVERIAVVVSGNQWTGTWHGVQGDDCDRASMTLEAVVSANGQTKVTLVENAVKTTSQVRALDADAHAVTLPLPRNRKDAQSVVRTLVLDFETGGAAIDGVDEFRLCGRASVPASPLRTAVLEEIAGGTTNALAWLALSDDPKKGTCAVSGKLWDGANVKATVPLILDGGDVCLAPFLVTGKAGGGPVYGFSLAPDGTCRCLRESGGALDVRVTTGAFSPEELKAFKTFGRATEDARVALDFSGGGEMEDLLAALEVDAGMEKSAVAAKTGLVTLKSADKATGWSYVCELVPCRENAGEVHFRGFATATRTMNGVKTTVHGRAETRSEGK